MSEARPAVDPARQTEPVPGGVDQTTRSQPQALVIQEGDDAIEKLRAQLEALQAKDAERERQLQERNDQLEAERKAREWAESRRREAESQAQAASTTAEAGRRSAEDAQLEALTAGLETNKNQTLALQAQYEAAFAEGNAKLVAELQVKIAENAANASQLRLGKEQLERQKAEREANPRGNGQPTPADVTAAREAWIAQRPPALQAWLRDTPHGHRFFDDPTFQKHVNESAAAVEREGFSVHHPKYIEMVEIRAGIRSAPTTSDPGVTVTTTPSTGATPQTPTPQTPYEQPRVQPRGREPMLAAPAGGSAPGVGGGVGAPTQVYLSAAELEQARLSGIPPEQYALEKQKLLAEGRLFSGGRGRY